jgi:hypothetical protein
MSLKQKLITLLDRLIDLSTRYRSVSWAIHGVIAIPLTLVFGPLAVFVAFAIREAEQVVHQLVYGVEIDTVDVFFDVFVPTAVAGLVAIVAGIP